MSASKQEPSIYGWPLRETAVCIEWKAQVWMLRKKKEFNPEVSACLSSLINVSLAPMQHDSYMKQKVVKSGQP